MRKVICVIVLVFSLLLFAPNVAYAQDNIFPERFIKLNYESYELYQEYENTFEYLVTYTLPYRYSDDIVTYNHFIYHNKFGYGFIRGHDINKNSTIVQTINRYSNYTRIKFRIVINKDMVYSEYPDGDITPFFEEDSTMYLRDDGYLYEKAYEDGIKDGIKSITNKPITILLEWTVPFVTLVIIAGIYIGYKREWFKK